MRNLFLLLLAVLLFGTAVQAQNQTHVQPGYSYNTTGTPPVITRFQINGAQLYPATFVDPRSAPFNADPTGVKDATAALQAAIVATGSGQLACPGNSIFTISGTVFLYVANGGITWTGPPSCIIKVKTGLSSKITAIVDGSSSVGAYIDSHIGGFTIEGQNISGTGSMANGLLVYDHDWGNYDNLIVNNATNDAIVVNEHGAGRTTVAVAATASVTVVTPATMSPDGYAIQAGTLLDVDCNGAAPDSDASGCNIANSNYEQLVVSAITATTFTVTFAKPHSAGFPVTRLGFADLITFTNPHTTYAGRSGFEVISGPDTNGITITRPVFSHAAVAGGILRGDYGIITPGQFYANAGYALEVGGVGDYTSLSAKFWDIAAPLDLESNGHDCFLATADAYLTLFHTFDTTPSNIVCQGDANTTNVIMGATSISGISVSNTSNILANQGSVQILPGVGTSGNNGSTITASCGSSACGANRLNFSSYGAAPITLNVLTNPSNGNSGKNGTQFGDGAGNVVGAVLGNGNAYYTSVRGTAVTYANLPASPVEGMLVAVTDAATITWGAAVVTGGSTGHVLAYYNGSGWTVAGK